MKTNKLWSILVMLVLALCSSISLTACGSDDEDDTTGINNNSSANSTGILGTWYYNDVDEGDVEYGEFTFLNDGTGIRYEKETEKGKVLEDTYYFAWKTVGNILYIHWYEKKEDIKPIDENNKKTWGEDCQFTISANKMKLVYDYDEPDSEVDIITLTRK